MKTDDSIIVPMMLIGAVACFFLCLKVVALETQNKRLTDDNKEYNIVLEAKKLCDKQYMIVKYTLNKDTREPEKITASCTNKQY